MRKRIEMAGLTFERLTVIEISEKNGRKDSYWKCRCDCGSIRIVRRSSLISGQTKSCGCYAREISMSHGMSQKKEYKIWRGIISRCENKNATGFNIYGGRGILICSRWRTSFENFYSDMGPMPSPKHSIDRVNSNGNYEPSNCKWATRQEQILNRRKRKDALPIDVKQISRKFRVTEGIVREWYRKGESYFQNKITHYEGKLQ